MLESRGCVFFLSRGFTYLGLRIWALWLRNRVLDVIKVEGLSFRMVVLVEKHCPPWRVLDFGSCGCFFHPDVGSRRNVALFTTLQIARLALCPSSYKWNLANTVNSYERGLSHGIAV